MARAYVKKLKGGRDGKPCTSGSCTEPWSAGGTGGFSPCGIPKGLGSDNFDYTTDPWTLDDGRLSGAEVAKHTFTPGSVAELKVLATAHHMGHFVFGICPDASLSGSAYGTPPTTVPDCSTVGDPTIKASCEAGYMSPLDTYAPAQNLMDCFLGRGAWANGRDGAGLLQRSEEHEHNDPGPIDQAHPERWYLPPDSWTLGGSSGGGWPAGSQKGHFTMHYKIPSNLKCVGGKCLIHFFYWTANSCTGKGYNKYFSEYDAKYGYQPKATCAGSKCPSGKVSAGVPLGAWAMSGQWWHGSPQYDGGSCESKVDDSPTNTWSRLNPERFWNCADIASGSSGGPNPPPAPGCTAATCAERECQTGSCSGDTCVRHDKPAGTACSSACGSCRQALCQAGLCACVNLADGSGCSGGSCQSGSCVTAPPPTGPSPPAAVDCVASVSCTWGPCSAACGGGVRTKTCSRQVTTQPSNGGRSCDEVAPVGPSVTEDCATGACPDPGKSCVGSVGKWDSCLPDSPGAPPKCCPVGTVCCGNQWWAGCRDTCSSSEQSYAAKNDGESDSGVSSGLAAALGLVGGLCVGAGGVFAVVKATGGGSQQPQQV